MSNLKRHTRADKIKWIITTIVLIAIISAIAVLGVKLSRQTTTTRIGAEAYEIGCITELGENDEANTSIRLRNGVTVDGLKIEVGKDSKVTYQVFYYDENGEFISASEELNSDLDSTTIPETAETARIEITPTADEDGTVGLLEVVGYAKQITVTVNK